MASLAERAVVREQYRALLEMRWTVFVRGLRGTESWLLLVFRILFRLVMLGIAIGVAVGAGFAVYVGLASDRPSLVTHTFGWTFIVWQAYVLVRSSLTHDVGRTLLRFPLRFRTYVTLWTISGLTDFPTMIGATVCLGIFCGVCAAQVSPAVAFAVCALFFLVNLALSRALYLWAERLLAHRRTRELVLVLLSMLGLLPQLLRSGYHLPSWATPPWLLAALRWLPPALAAHALTNTAPFHRSTALAELAAVLAVLLLLIAYRLLRAWHGEDLHESAASVPVSRTAVVRSAPRVGDTGDAAHPVFAVLEIEFTKLRHNGPAIYQILTPLLFILIFGLRLASHHSQGWLLPGGAMYLSLDIARCYNAFGTDGPGMQIYRLAPVSMRSVYLGKNLYQVSITSLQCLLLALLTLYVGHIALPLTLLAVTFMAFALAVHLTLGNWTSLRFARRADSARVTLQTARQRRNGAAGGWRAMIALFGVPLVGIAISALAVFLHRLYLAPAIMLFLAASACWIYWRRLQAADAVDPFAMEQALGALTKTQ